MKNKTIVFVVAHADDEWYCAGGTISKLCKNNNVVVLICAKETFVNRDTLEKVEIDPYTEIKQHFSTVTFINLGFEALDLKNCKDLNDKIKTTLYTIKPDVVFTHHFSDLHNDHVVVNGAVLIATRVLACKLYFMFSPDSTFFAAQKTFKSNTKIVISEEDMHNKLLALSAFKTELTDTGPRSIDAIIHFDSYNGISCSAKYAEIFELYNEVLL